MNDYEISALRRLLTPGRASLRARYQNEHGGYDGETIDVSDEALRQHLSGQITLGFVCAEGGRSKYFAIDIDRGFASKLPAIAEVLERRRWDCRSIVTSGSDPGRGKVLVFFKRRYSTTTLQQLARDVYRDAAAQGNWPAIEAPSDVSYFPTRGEGGLLRIGGRNRRPDRNARDFDAFMSPDGEPRSFSGIVPAGGVRVATPTVRPVAPRLSRWSRGLIENGIAKHPGSNVLYAKTLQRLAREYVHVFGPAGEAQFVAATERLWNRSPALHQPSPKTADKRSRANFERGRKHAWACALTAHEEAIQHPGERSIASSCYTRETNALYCFLQSWVRQCQLNADAFGCGSRLVADYLGLTPSAGWKRLRRAEREGAIVVHHPGTRGAHGLPMLIGLVSPKDTPRSVLDRGRSRPIVRERLTVVG